MDSILTSIKKQLGATEAYTHFDEQIIMHINMALMVLRQIGVGPSKGFRISDASATWKDFLGESEELEAVKTYVYMKVKLVFDPPQNSAHITALKEGIAEFEARLNYEVDPAPKT